LTRTVFGAVVCVCAGVATGVISAQKAPAASTPTPAPQTAAAAQRPKPVMMAAIEPALLSGLKYRQVGPSRGGRVTAVTGVPSQPKTFYMGVASGGVFRTTDSGVTWEPISDFQIPLGSIGSIAVADSNPDIIYVGTGSDGVRSNVSTGRGIYKTTDGGKTWAFSGLRDGGQTGAIRVHPSNPDIVIAAMTGDIFKANTERGVFKSVDGGKTWKKTLYLTDQFGAMDVEFQPGNPSVVYAWMSRLERKPWTIISGAAEGGFYKSTNGGDSFTKIAEGLPKGLIGKGNLATTAANPNRIYALVEAKPGGGLYRSDDAGATWAQVNATPGLVQRPFYYTTLGADQVNADVVYAGAESFYKSVDGGKTLTSMRTPHGDNHDIWVNPKDGNIMIQSNDGGANVSTDGGRTWSTQMNQVTGEFYAVTADNAFPYKIYGAQQDDSTVILSSVANPYTLTDWRGGPGCETGPIFPHPTDPNTVYGSCKGQYEVLDLRTNQSKTYWIGGQSLYGNAGNELILRFQRVSPMNTSPFDPNVLYYGSQFLHRTRDKGVTWEKISPDLTAFPPCCQGPSGEPITRDVTGEEFYSTLYAISESPLEKGVIWTGSNDGPFSVTRDNGLTWKRVTPPDMPDGGRVAFIDPSPHRRGSAYYAAYRYLMGDYAPYIYKTDDYGKTWRRLTDGKNGIPADTPTRVVREDPNREGLLYAGTEFGMYISFDDGAHWQAFFLNMPQIPINDIRIHKKDLLIATQGRAFWILDNLTALHQVTPAVTKDAVKLFAPRDGYRTRVSPATLGPVFDYYLPSVPTGPVLIEVLDAKGTVLNSYNSDTAAAAGGRGGRGGRGGPPSPSAGQAPAGQASAGQAGGATGRAGGADQAQADPDAAPASGRGGGGVQTRVTKDAGFNRVAWNVQSKDGVTLPPGAYQVKLSVGGVSQTQPFKVLIDPNVAASGVTVADLVEQYQHVLKVRAFTQKVTELVTRVREARTAAQKAPIDRDRLGAIDTIYSQLTTWPEGVRYSRPGLQAHTSYLAGLGTRADQKVGRDAIERLVVLENDYKRLKAETDKLLGS
jgi:photosystem II stability/assembly factor-like uncharacterized protein